MENIALPLISAFWLGILTSISPCPLASNITAISFIGQRMQGPRKVLISGLLYTCGRMLAYLLIGALLISSLLSTPAISHYLQKYMNIVLGPILIAVGMILLELLSINLGHSSWLEKMRLKSSTSGLWGSFILGILFALSFCPTSAALFFGSLIPLAIKEQSTVSLPAIYGVATGIPVLLFALIISISAEKVGSFFSAITTIEKWARKITAVLFIGVGIYYCTVYIFKMG